MKQSVIVPKQTWIYKIKIKYLVLYSLFLIVLYSSLTYASILGESQSTIKHEEHNPHEIIDMFYAAVKRGELIVFDQRYDKSMIIPLRVEYVYELNGARPVVNIYSELKRLTPIPLYKGIKLRSISGVSAILHDDGHIIEVRAHVIFE